MKKFWSALFPPLLLLLLLLCATIVTSSKGKPPEVLTNTIRIVGGFRAEEKFAPYVISLQYININYHFCGGAILNERYVITAAHCVHGKNLTNIVIVTGTNQWKMPGAIHNIEKAIVHCNYIHDEYHNDIALIRIKDKITFNYHTSPIKRPYKPMKSGTHVILTGWGNTRQGHTENLKKITLKYIAWDKCNKMLKDDELHHLSIDQICTYTKKAEGPCYRDSGGPLVTKDNYLVGIVNWGKPCALGSPDAYASTLYYSDWINTHLSENCSCQV